MIIMAEDEVKFIDAETYRRSKGEAISFQQIVLNQVSRTTKLMSKEFHGGFFNERVKQIGEVPIVEKTYVEDAREAFKNSVNCIYDLLYPQFDDKMKQEEKEFNKEVKAKIEEWNKEVDKTTITKDVAKNRMTEEHRILFRNLISLLHRLDYLKETETEE